MRELTIPAGNGMLARVRCSDRSDGDFRISPCSSADPNRSSNRDRGDDPAGLRCRRQALMSGPWTWLRQEHGSRIVNVSGLDRAAGSTADGAVTRVPGAVLAIHTADCVPVAIAGAGTLGVAHAGWKGIVAGVLSKLVDAIRTKAGVTSSSGDRLHALMGPMIRPRDYEFGLVDLASVRAVSGTGVESVTHLGTPALDLGAAVRGVLARCGVTEITDWGLDTSSPRFFSHRLRGDVGRIAFVARLERAT